MHLASRRASSGARLSAPLLRRPGLPLPRRPAAPAPTPTGTRGAARAAAGDDGGGGGKGEAEASFEDLFQQELKRRGIEDAKKGSSSSSSSSSSSPSSSSGPRAAASNPFASAAGPRAAGAGPRDETRGRPRQGAAAAGDGEGETDGQRERSMRLVSEGLDGLIPRARELVLLGGSVFLGFLPAMLIFSLVFTGVFSVFGENFVHGGRQGALPTYVDPEELLASPTVDRFVPFRPDDGF